MEFFEQASSAHEMVENRTNAILQNEVWQRETELRPGAKMGSIIKHQSLGALEQHVGAGDFGEFADLAYATPSGYAIRDNPMTGEREMFVAGTRSGMDWILNGYDAWASHHGILGTDVVRSMQIKRLEKAAKENGVAVIYGHSRGAAIVADMTLETGVERVGLDGAMLIAANKDLWNIQESQMFDSVIGFSGNQNEKADYGPSFHKIWK